VEDCLHPNERGAGTMQATPTQAVSRTSGIVGLIGGLALIIGSFMVWVKLAFDGAAFAEILGIDPSLIQGSGLPDAVTVNGIDRDGKFTLVCGIVAWGR
jgi:hypothetical protein